MNRIQTIRNRLEQEKGRKTQIESSIHSLSDRMKERGREIRRIEQAREIIRQVGLKTQEQLQVHIGDITSLAMEAVFPDPYEVVVNFVERRNQTECDLKFHRHGTEVNPMDASGGGAVDVAAFALRIASWSMQVPKTRNTIILDEPLRFLSTNMQEQASQMIKELSDKLNLQFIIVTHEDTLTQYADKVFTIKIRKGVSQIQ